MVQKSVFAENSLYSVCGYDKGPIDTILNVFLFVPRGLFLPLLYDEFDKVGKILLTRFIISLSVEIIQVFGCGATDINDLITNTIGACIGYGVYKVMEKCIPEKRIGVFRISGWNGYFELIGFWLGTVIMMLDVQPLLFHRFFRRFLMKRLVLRKKTEIV